MATTLAQSLRADSVSRLPLRPVCSVDVATPVDETIRCMVDRRIGCALVTENDQLVGIFTERDFVDRVIKPQLDTAQPVGRVMTRRKSNTLPMIATIVKTKTPTQPTLTSNSIRVLWKLKPMRSEMPA